MSCPICDHTMKKVGEMPFNIYWCARCGTLRTYDVSVVPEIESPMLVTRCREFWSKGMSAQYLSNGARALWNTTGIGESIWPEGARETGGVK